MESYKDSPGPSPTSIGTSSAELAEKLAGFAPDMTWRVRTATRFAVPSGRIYLVDGSPRQGEPSVSLEDAERTAARVAEEFGKGNI
jgi:hypothetical protein